MQPRRLRRADCFWPPPTTLCCWALKPTGEQQRQQQGGLYRGLDDEYLQERALSSLLDWLADAPGRQDCQCACLSFAWRPAGRRWCWWCSILVQARWGCCSTDPLAWLCGQARVACGLPSSARLRACRRCLLTTGALVCSEQSGLFCSWGIVVSTSSAVQSTWSQQVMHWMLSMSRVGVCLAAVQGVLWGAGAARRECRHLLCMALPDSPPLGNRSTLHIMPAQRTAATRPRVFIVHISLHCVCLALVVCCRCSTCCMVTT